MENHVAGRVRLCIISSHHLQKRLVNIEIGLISKIKKKIQFEHYVHCHLQSQNHRMLEGWDGP